MTNDGFPWSMKADGMKAYSAGYLAPWLIVLASLFHSFQICRWFYARMSKAKLVWKWNPSTRACSCAWWPKTAPLPWAGFDLEIKSCRSMATMWPDSTRTKSTTSSRKHLLTTSSWPSETGRLWTHLLPHVIQLGAPVKMFPHFIVQWDAWKMSPRRSSSGSTLKVNGFQV